VAGTLLSAAPALMPAGPRVHSAAADTAIGERVQVRQLIDGDQKHPDESGCGS